MRAIGLILNIMQLICTIYKLQTAKVQATNSGHLNLRDATILLIFMILMTASGLASAMITDLEARIIIDMLRDIIDYILAIMYFKMITKFIASFQLQTTVDQDGKIQIVAIEPNGIEVFRFTLEGEQYTNLLGIATTVLDVKSYGKKKALGNQQQKIAENDGQSSDEITDAGTYVQTESDITKSDFISDFQGGRGADPNQGQLSPVNISDVDQINQSIRLSDYTKMTKPTSPQTQYSMSRFEDLPDH